MADVLKKIYTPQGGTAPSILANASKVSIGQGATGGIDSVGTKEEVTHGNLACTEATPIGKNQTAYVFLDNTGTKGFLDTEPDGANLPVARAFRIGRAWRGDDGNFIVCQGKRGTGSVSYNIGGDPVPRRLIDDGSASAPTAPTSPFQGHGGMTYTVAVTVKGSGKATVQVRDSAGNIASNTVYTPGNNQPDQVVLGSVGDVLEFTTDPGTTITMTVSRGVETV